MTGLWPFVCYVLAVALVYAMVSPLWAGVMLLWVPLLMILRDVHNIWRAVVVLVHLISQDHTSETIDWDALARKLKQDDD
jgi:hypothetical protein